MSAAGIPAVDRIVRGRSSAAGRGRRAGRRTAWSALVLRAGRRPGHRGGAGAPAVPAGRRDRSRCPGSTGEVEVVRDDARHPAAVRRHDGRPDGRAGLRARPGAVLRDGRPPARDGRPAVGAVRRGHPGDRRRSSARWAGAQVAEQELPLLEPRTRAALDAYAAGVNAYLDSHSPSRDRGASTPSSASAGSTTGRSRGRRSTRWPGSRRWRGTSRATSTRRSSGPWCRPTTRRSRWPSSIPAYDYQAHRPIVGQGAVVDGVFEQDAEDGRYPQPGAAGVHRRPARAARRACSAALDGCRAFLGRRATTDRAATAGWSTASTPRPAQPLLANDPHLGVERAGHLGADGAALPHRQRRVPASTSPGFTFSGRAGRGDRPQRRHRLGFHQPRPRRHRPLPRAGHRRRVGAGRPAAAARARARRRSRCAARTTSPSRCASTAHGPLLSDASTSTPTSPATRPTTRRAAGRRPPSRRHRARHLAGLDGADAVARPPTRSSASTPRTDWDSFREAASAFAVPAQNIVYADRDGHIGYQAPGLVPIRKSGNDGLAAPGGLAAARTTGPATTCRSTGCPTCSTPTRASSSRPTRP